MWVNVRRKHPLALWSWRASASRLLEVIFVGECKQAVVYWRLKKYNAIIWVIAPFERFPFVWLNKAQQKDSCLEELCRRKWNSDRSKDHENHPSWLDCNALMSRGIGRIGARKIDGTRNHLLGQWASSRIRLGQKLWRDRKCVRELGRIFVWVIDHSSSIRVRLYTENWCVKWMSEALSVLNT